MDHFFFPNGDTTVSETEPKSVAIGALCPVGTVVLSYSLGAYLQRVSTGWIELEDSAAEGFREVYSNRADRRAADKARVAAAQGASYSLQNRAHLR